MQETGIDVIFLQLFSKESGEISGPARHINVSLGVPALLAWLCALLMLNLSCRKSISHTPLRKLIKFPVKTLFPWKFR